MMASESVNPVDKNLNKLVQLKIFSGLEFLTVPIIVKLFSLVQTISCIPRLQCTMLISLIATFLSPPLAAGCCGNLNICQITTLSATITGMNSTEIFAICLNLPEMTAILQQQKLCQIAGWNTC